ncbi:Glycerophosphodiesterase [Phytophthora palmivora]|uniref:Glycerophosphodiesterase n=1 Tax=Phytophthora palmivora TaxID=4796 RepID=A0A2P4WX58_9STRA|nr:Glycerophosphodiesterase [Phytophthora palmivora]
MGRSYYQVDGYRLALTRENTLASFILAGRSGADFVEFDVQLTKDRVPVIYHDFMVNVGLEDKYARSFGTKPEMYEIGIHDMSFRQLTQSYTAPVPHKGNKRQVLQDRVKKHWARLQGDKGLPSPKHGPLGDNTSATEEGHLVDFFPRLEDLLKHVPAEVGLNIEVKYPDDFFRTEMRSLSCFAINAYIDRVLQCVFDYAGSRRIFFSCFDPSICIALRAKQAKYPVLFLTYGSMAPHAMDARMTLQFATNLVKMEKLQGIVSNSNSFIETPELTSLVKKDLGSVLLTWGDQNTNHEMVQLQKRHAIDGVISDNVIDIINQDKKLQAQSK